MMPLRTAPLHRTSHDTNLDLCHMQMVCGWAAVFLAWYPAAIADQSDGDRNVTPQSRTFRIDYGARLTKLPRGSRVRVWLPVPPSTASQSVKVLATDLPVRGMSSVEPAYGNQVLYFEVEGPKSGSVDFTTSYLVRRSEIRAKVGSTRGKSS